MKSNGHNPEDGAWPETGPHEKFFELCALSTTGELTAKERDELQAHLEDCSECRQALKEFEATADVGMPLLHAHLSASESLEPASHPSETTKAMGAKNVAQVTTARNETEPVVNGSGLGLNRLNGHSRLQVNWNYVWMPFAAAMVLSVTLGLFLYQFGRHSGQEVAEREPVSHDAKLDALEQKLSDAGHEQEVLKSQVAQRDGMIAGLHQQLKEQAALVVEMKKSQADLESSLQTDLSEKQQMDQDKAALAQKFDSLQASLQKTETELNSLQQQRAQDGALTGSLEAQITDLHGQLRDREQDLGKEQELLAHDQDIRDLMGARDLYIAEVYDVARDGQTQKPYGRVFYTKGKSLVFYAYDLDQQAGLKRASAFQVWGSHGLDRQQATSLGIFYEDNLAKKRWVLKFDDPKKLEQIDAVFVTVEPNGGSHKPSGKPLLFAYLKVEPNHP
jgi:anti-sigma factor RsiW